MKKDLMIDDIDLHCNIGDTIKKYINICVKWGNYIESGDSKNANKCFPVIQEIHNAVVKENNRNVILSFKDLFSHDNDTVRLETSVLFLRLHHSRLKALYVLYKISKKKKSLIAFTAKMILKEYIKGNLKW